MCSTTPANPKWPTSKGSPGPKKSSAPSSYSWASPFWLPPSSSSSAPPSPCTKKRFVPRRPPARISSSSSIKESIASSVRTLDIPVRRNHKSGSRKSGKPYSNVSHAASVGTGNLQVRYFYIPILCQDTFQVLMAIEHSA